MIREFLTYGKEEVCSCCGRTFMDNHNAYYNCCKCGYGYYICPDCASKNFLCNCGGKIIANDDYLKLKGIDPRSIIY